MQTNDGIRGEVNFNILRYANCWEDADILLEALKPEPHSTIISIGSAGDNSFSLLTTHPARLVVADISAVQLHLIELKKVCFQALDYEAMLSFFGCHPSTERIKTYKSTLRKRLSNEALNYWDKELYSIQNGIIFSGKFEKYFRLFHKRVLPLIHNHKTVAQLFEEKSPDAQLVFYSRVWNSAAWRLLFKIFFSRFVMGRLGRAPGLLKEVSLSVHDFVFSKAEEHLKAIEAQHNPYLKYILCGNFGHELPHYLRPENFESIRQNIHKIEFRHGYIQDIIVDTPYQFLNLSNIFEYMTGEEFAMVSQKIRDSIPAGGAIAYWNLMVPRRISSLWEEDFYYDPIQCENLRGKDKCFFYSDFITERRK